MRHLHLLVAIGMATALGCGSKAAADGGDAAPDTGLDDTATSADGTDPGPVDTSAPDVKAEVSKPACNPLQNTGCTDPANPKCGYGTDNKPVCQPGGTAKLGEACSNPNDCAQGLCLSCPTGKSVCANYCISDASCKAPQTCNTITGQTFKTCDWCSYESCKVETQSCKSATQACYTNTGNGAVCLDKGSTAIGDTCNAPNDCVPGATCVGASPGAPGVCRAICAPAAKLGCTPPTVQCENVDGEGYGFCPK